MLVRRIQNFADLSEHVGEFSGIVRLGHGFLETLSILSPQNIQESRVTEQKREQSGPQHDFPHFLHLGVFGQNPDKKPDDCDE
jgi:hypothetical protein